MYKRQVLNDLTEQPLQSTAALVEHAGRVQDGAVDAAALEDADILLSLIHILFPQPSLFMAVTVAKKGDEGKISSALARLMEEDVYKRQALPSSGSGVWASVQS